MTLRPLLNFYPKAIHVASKPPPAPAAVPDSNGFLLRRKRKNSPNNYVRNMNKILLLIFLPLFLVGCFSFSSKYDPDGIGYNMKFPYRADNEKALKLIENIAKIKIGDDITHVNTFLGCPDIELFNNKDLFTKYEKISKTFVYYLERSDDIEKSYRIYFNPKDEVIGILKIN
ncbi:MAG: hypothetical protein AB1724_19010 [Thermodesulfobacteriota bacterium]